MQKRNKFEPGQCSLCKGNEESNFRSWDGKAAVKSFKALPLIVAWGIWLSRNASLSDDRFIFPIQCAMQSLNILNSFKQLKAEKPVRHIVEEVINRLGAWIYFDGETRGGL